MVLLKVFLCSNFLRCYHIKLKLIILYNVLIIYNRKWKRIKAKIYNKIVDFKQSMDTELQNAQ